MNPVLLAFPVVFPPPAPATSVAPVPAAISAPIAAVTPLAPLPATPAVPARGVLAVEPFRRVAVVCLGNDAAIAGDLQRAVEERLQAIPGVYVVREPRDPHPEAPPHDATDDEAATLFSDAKIAFADAEYARALDRLSALTTIRGQLGGGTADEHVQILLWRAATFLALGAELDAEAEATEALNLAPDIPVTATAYSPKLADLVGQLRAKLPLPVTLALSDLPVDASIRVDGRPVTRTVRVLRGMHRIRIVSPGFRTWEKSIAVDANLSLTPGLAPALERNVEERLAEATWWGALAPESEAAVASLFRLTGADYLLVVATRPGSPAVARAMLVPAERTNAVLHGGSIPLDSAAAMRLADLAIVTGRPDAAIDIAGPPPTPVTRAVPR